MEDAEIFVDHPVGDEKTYWPRTPTSYASPILVAGFVAAIPASASPVRGHNLHLHGYSVYVLLRYIHRHLLNT